MAIRVLFLCSDNSARSQIAEGLLRHLGGPRFDAHSAGTSPRAEVHPMAVQAMAYQGVDIRSQVPKDLKTYADQTFDWVITLCERAREDCPIMPGAETVHWCFADPALVASETEQRRVFRETVLGLKRRVELFVTATRGAGP